QRVDVLGCLVAGGASGGRVLLVGDALHEKLGAVLVEELGALHLDGLQLGEGAPREGEERHRKLRQRHGARYEAQSMDGAERMARRAVPCKSAGFRAVGEAEVEREEKALVNKIP